MYTQKQLFFTAEVSQIPQTILEWQQGCRAKPQYSWGVTSPLAGIKNYNKPLG